MNHEPQLVRFGGYHSVRTKSEMTPKVIKKHCELGPESASMLEHAMTDMNFSARAHGRILKVARTLADLRGLEQMSADNMLEVVSYRSLDRNLWT